MAEFIFSPFEWNADYERTAGLSLAARGLYFELLRRYHGMSFGARDRVLAGGTILREVGAKAALRELIKSDLVWWDGDQLKIRSRPYARFVRQKVTETTRARILLRDGFTCRSCGSGTNLSVDHIFPTTLGGDNEDENLQVLCRPCNSKKGATWLESDPSTPTSGPMAKSKVFDRCSP